MLIITSVYQLHSFIPKQTGLASAVTEAHKYPKLSLMQNTKQLRGNTHLPIILVLIGGFIHQSCDLSWPSLGLQKCYPLMYNNLYQHFLKKGRCSTCAQIHSSSQSSFELNVRFTLTFSYIHISVGIQHMHVSLYGCKWFSGCLSGCTQA